MKVAAAVAMATLLLTGLASTIVPVIAIDIVQWRGPKDDTQIAIGHADFPQRVMVD